MITKELETNKMCLFCASDYHLEMILLPYIKERIDNSKFIIFTENNLEETLSILLTKVTFDEKLKTQILNLNWQSEDNLKFEYLEEVIKSNKNVNIIINGEYNYITVLNNKVKEFINKNVNIINCYHVSDSNVDIDEISKKYKYILNTQKL